MGYSTSYDGVLKFKNDLTTKELAYLSQFLGEDIREHKEWQGFKHASELYYTIDLELTKDFLGLQWHGGEKCYEMVAQINFLTAAMRENFKKDFEFEGELICQGEEADDRWKLVINEDGWAESIDFPRIGEKLRCPHCYEVFVLDEDVERVEDDDE